MKSNVIKKYLLIFILVLSVFLIGEITSTHTNTSTGASSQALSKIKGKGLFKMMSHKNNESLKLKTKVKSSTNSLFSYEQEKRKLENMFLKNSLAGKSNENMNFLQIKDENKSENVSTSNQTNENNKSKILKNLMMVKNMDFDNFQIFPQVRMNDGTFKNFDHNQDFFLINQTTKEKEKENNTENDSLVVRQFNFAKKLLFYSKLINKSILISEQSSSLNAILSIDLSKISSVTRQMSPYTRLEDCIDLSGKSFSATSQSNWTICFENSQIQRAWYCALTKIVYKIEDQICNGGVVDKYIPPVVPSCHPNCPPPSCYPNCGPTIIDPVNKQCNAKWDYKFNGQDWECLCKNGTRQSPIDLPHINSCVNDPKKTLFYYNNGLSSNQYSTLDYANVKNQKPTIEYKDHSIKIVSNEIGKLVTPEGATFKAEEVIFKTPSEHTIMGERFDLEIQIIHSGISVGDISKKVYLCLLFKSKPGVENRFISDLNYFSLPNWSLPKKVIEEALNFNKIMLNKDEPINTVDENYLKKFSFYKYFGSETTPPCSEETTFYVRSDPMYIGSTVINLFKEALRTNKGEERTSYRITQNRNERPVYHYKCGDECVVQPTQFVEEGHYEKINTQAVEYFYVHHDKPSGVPNSFVVTDDEAKSNAGNLK